MEQIQNNRRIILISLVALMLICLLGILAYNVFFASSGGDIADTPPTATPAATEEETEAISTPVDDESTPTPTRVISEGAEETPTSEATSDVPSDVTSEPTTEATPQPTTETAPTPQPTATSSGAMALAPGQTTMIEVVDTSQIENVLENGGFDASFDDKGVAESWEAFQTDGASYAFSAETSEPFVQSGDSAQRISVQNAVEADRFGGIYQTVEVIPGEVYTLTLYGQIRSGFGDVNASGYGYRMQYGIDNDGGTNWRAIPADEWVELPWDEQLINGSEFEFVKYTAEFTPTSDELTLFVRTWNKWPIQSLAEYTLDSISLVGPAPGNVMLVSVDTGEMAEAGASPATGTDSTGSSQAATDDELIDQPLPVTGLGNGPNFMEDGRFWAGVFILLMLAGGAVCRAKWGW